MKTKAKDFKPPIWEFSHLAIPASELKISYVEGSSPRVAKAIANKLVKIDPKDTEGRFKARQKVLEKLGVNDWNGHGN